MTLRVVFRRAAKTEFEDAAVWYGEKRRVSAMSLSVRSRKPLRMPHLHRNAIQRYSVMSGACSRAAFHSQSTSVSVRIRWLSLLSFTRVEIQPYGSGGYDRAIDSDTWRAGALHTRARYLGRYPTAEVTNGPPDPPGCCADGRECAHA